MIRPSRLLSLCAALSCAVTISEAASGHLSRSRQHAQLVRRDVASSEKRGENHGMATFYNAETGNMGACGWFIGNSDWTVAIKGSMYGDYGRKSTWCGQKITITANGKTARNVIIGDACPGCPEGASLDMTPELFKYFANPDTGVIPISWHLSAEDSDNTKNWRPLAPAKNLWKPSAPSAKLAEQKQTPSHTPTPTSKQWQPLAVWTRSGGPTEVAELVPALSTVVPPSSPPYSAMNATRTTLVNGTDVKNITLSNSTAIASLMRSDSTVSLLPSDGVVPARNASSTRQRHSSNASYGGNLQRAAQVVLDLAGLTYAAAAT